MRSAIRRAAVPATLCLLAGCGDLPTFARRLDAFGRARADAVPAAAPDEIAPEVLAESHEAWHVMTDEGIPGRVVRDRLWVRFHATATAEQRQAALDAVGGTVLGGMRLGGGADGVYYVAIAAGREEGAAPVLRAIAALKASPDVRYAIVDDLDGPAATWLAPRDGAAFASWRLHPDSAGGENWGAEAIAAPLAWGCATGDMSVGVAVVDEGFVATADLAPNIAHDAQLDVSTRTDHGTRVASVVGAAGDNGAGITGVMWRARLGMFDVARAAGAPSPAWRTAFAVRDAARAGYRVINVSAALDWRAQFGRLPANTLGDSAKADAARYALEEALDATRADADNPMPLVVLAASNDGIDAYWSGHAAAKLDGDYARQLVVVAATRNASDAASRLAAFSNRGALVDLAAPGEDVAALDGGDQLVRASGTSFAAPHVSGVAGLLLSLDPMMSVDALRAHLLGGAVAGARVADDASNGARPIPVVNAYASLRAAAGRAGGPLCGNRVWSDSNKIMVQRDAGAEAVFEAPDEVSDVRAQHGSRIALSVAGFDTEIAYRYGTWAGGSALGLAPDSLPGDGDRSRAALSHGGDSVAFVDGDSLFVRDVAAGQDRAIAALDDGVGAAGATAGPCVEADDAQGAACAARLGARLGTAGWQSVARAAVAYSPLGGEVYVAQPFESSVVTHGAWTPCAGAGWCRPSAVRLVVDSTVVSAVQIATGRRTRLFVIPGQLVLALSASDGGGEASRELAVQSAPLSLSWKLVGAAADPAEPDEVWSEGGCELAFRTRTGAVALAVPTSCVGGSPRLGPRSGGTFAPSKGRRVTRIGRI